MKDKETEDVKKFFHGYAQDFDSIYGHTKNRSLLDKIADKLFRQSMYRRYEECVKETMKPEIKTVLDIGCGSGHYCEAFLKQGKKVTGIDIAEGMLEIAKKKTKEYLEKGQVKYILDDYSTHTFDEKHDAACLTGFFDYIKEPVKIFEKLKKDVSKEIYMSFPKAGGILAWQRKVRYNMRNCPLYLYKKSNLISMLEEVGWKGKYEIRDLDRDYFVKVKLQ
ncbi:MAG: methyltransferase domain-containing protein [Cytophagaceae bacterium]|nr:methyltransferase domain-containing protein [Cytophagaceae bacterium]MDW8456909.1 methyltransferase domain-containing protein [Cytophagaceae bacterium]